MHEKRAPAGSFFCLYQDDSILRDLTEDNFLII